jgi:hypothetical protein
MPLAIVLEAELEDVAESTELSESAVNALLSPRFNSTLLACYSTSSFALRPINIEDPGTPGAVKLVPQYGTVVAEDRSGVSGESLSNCFAKDNVISLSESAPLAASTHMALPALVCVY